MKIATWNVAYGVSPSKNQRILEQMDKVDADVWVLTETHDELRPSTPGPWFATTSDQRPHESQGVRNGSRWSTIWTRFTIIETVRPDHDPVRTTACVIQTPLGALLVFGTVLPWYQDVSHSVAEEIARQSEDWKAIQQSRGNVPMCVAGDFNVNLGGPHYYGRADGKEAVRNCLVDQGLVTLSDFKHTGPAQFDKFGLIDHIAVSASLAERAGRTDVWSRANERGETMSDHCGVAIDFFTEPELAVVTF
jgi:endonuclease/exonuclease/phosphatase family metal-dependent hydrolase